MYFEETCLGSNISFQTLITKIKVNGQGTYDPLSDCMTRILNKTLTSLPLCIGGQTIVYEVRVRGVNRFSREMSWFSHKPLVGEWSDPMTTSYKCPDQQPDFNFYRVAYIGGPLVAVVLLLAGAVLAYFASWKYIR